MYLFLHHRLGSATKPVVLWRAVEAVQLHDQGVQPGSPLPKGEAHGRAGCLQGRSSAVLCALLLRMGSAVLWRFPGLSPLCFSGNLKLCLLLPLFAAAAPLALAPTEAPPGCQWQLLAVQCQQSVETAALGRMTQFA